MKKPLVFLFLVILMSVLIPTVHAAPECKCGKPKTVEDSFKESDVVFLGQVISVEKASVLREGHKVVKLLMTIPYKGTDILPATEYITIYTEDGSCGVEFIRQNDYLIFAKGDPAFLKTSTCYLTDIQENSRDKQMKVEKLVKGE